MISNIGKNTQKSLGALLGADVEDIAVPTFVKLGIAESLRRQEDTSKAKIKEE